MLAVEREEGGTEPEIHSPLGISYHDECGSEVSCATVRIIVINSSQVACKEPTRRLPKGVALALAALLPDSLVSLTP